MMYQILSKYNWKLSYFMIAQEGRNFKVLERKKNNKLNLTIFPLPLLLYIKKLHHFPIFVRNSLELRLR